MAKINKIMMTSKHIIKQSKEDHTMKALFGFMIISILLLASCSTSQFTSSAYDDEIYGGASSSEMKVMVTEDNSNYRTPRYAEKRKTYSDNNHTIYVDKVREDESSRKAAQEYYKKDTVYYEGDSVIYIEEIIDEEPYYEYEYDNYGFDYSSRINSFHRPWRYNYYGHYDPFFYSYYPGYSGYNSWDLGWSLYNGFYMNWSLPINFYSPNAFFNNYWDRYNYYGYGYGYDYYNYGNKAVNHHNSNNNSRYYGHRTNRGRNDFDSNQAASASRGLKSSSVSRGSATYDPQLDSKRGDRVIDKSTNRNKTLRAPNLKNTVNSTYTQKRESSSRERLTKSGVINPRSQEKSIVRYRKPKTYTTPSSRTSGTSREYQLPQSTQNRAKATGTRTVRRVVTNPSRTKSYSTPTKSSRNYSTPTRSSSQRYKSPSRSSNSKSYSTPSKSSSSRSSGSSSRSVSSPSRSSSSGSSVSRSSGSSSRGSRKK